ncbi:hypothetical protein [Cohnella cholangitidis]|uniref:Uncharacterized protein n=1 Tax=Cohnella cholangitidis TaxID=2598458 RepID=A0A7G5C1R7_9BACL|nr:hypothetical protein [Cohnella cholangitidis]QMV43151.1 hypothetical protein FPL14_19650 [Cohnella cholangitidis]
MANQMIYSTENIDISADSDKKQVHIELASSGYRPKYVSLFIDDRDELERIIQALQTAKSSLE